MTKKTYLAAPLLVLLAACGGSNDGSATSPTQPTNVYSIDSGPAFRALSDGKSLTAQKGMVAARAMDWDNNITALKESEITLALNESNGMTMTINGKSYAFSDKNVEEADGYGYFIEDRTEGSSKFIGLFSNTGKLSQVLSLNNTQYSQLWQYYADFQDSNGDWSGSENGYFVVGTETKSEALGLFTAKTYGGFFNATVRESNGVAENRIRLNGDIKLNANFEKNSLSGNISSITITPYNGDDGVTSSREGTFLLTDGVISGSGFAGAVNADDQLLSSSGWASADGTFNGGFFGPDASEAAGTISATIENIDGTSSNLVGGFKSNDYR